METRQYKVMWFGLGGNVGEGICGEKDSFRSNWYLQPHELPKYIGDENSHYPQTEMEGCMLIDKTSVLRANPTLAIKSPLCNPKLPDNTIDQFDLNLLRTFPGKAIAQEFSKTDKGALATLSGYIGGLDDVSPDLYVAWWKAHGAKIGRVTEGKVCWEV